MPSNKIKKSASAANDKKKSTVKTAAKKTVAAPPVAPVVTENAPPVENTVSPEKRVQDQIDKIDAQILLMKKNFTTLGRDYKDLCKYVVRERKEYQRALSKRGGGKRGGGNSKPSGFAKPGFISAELCSFLGKPKGTEMARTDVTRYLTTYIKTHDLQNKKNKKEIICDAALQSLLKPNKGETVTYFNLQSYMKRHYEDPSPVLNA